MKIAKFHFVIIAKNSNVEQVSLYYCKNLAIANKTLLKSALELKKLCTSFMNESVRRFPALTV